MTVFCNIGPGVGLSRLSSIEIFLSGLWRLSFLGAVANVHSHRSYEGGFDHLHGLSHIYCLPIVRMGILSDGN